MKERDCYDCWLWSMVQLESCTLQTSNGDPWKSLRVESFICISLIRTRICMYSHVYNMTSSVSGKDEPNLAMWLATRAGKMELSWLFGIRGLSRKENPSCFGVLSRIINPLMTKLVRSRWHDIEEELGQLIQPSWPHAWSITHMYLLVCTCMYWCIYLYVVRVYPCYSVYYSRGVFVTIQLHTSIFYSQRGFPVASLAPRRQKTTEKYFTYSSLFEWTLSAPTR